jgi:hypothetical protein
VQANLGRFVHCCTMDPDLVVMEGDREGRLFASGMTLALLVALAPVVLGLGIVAVNM